MSSQKNRHEKVYFSQDKKLTWLESHLTIGANHLTFSDLPPTHTLMRVLHLGQWGRGEMRDRTHFQAIWVYAPVQNCSAMAVSDNYSLSKHIYLLIFFQTAPLPQGSLSPLKQDGLQFQVRPHHTLSSLPPYSFGNSHPTQQLNNLPWLSVLCILAFLFFFSVHHGKYYTKSASAVEFHILAHPGVPTVAVWDPCISMSFSIAKSFLTNRCLQQ